MSQVDVATSIGYALKNAAWALRGAMDEALRELDLSVPQYACLELLAQRPGLSNAELARGVFVSRQATHQLLAGLTGQALVAISGTGRAQRIALTRHGSAVLGGASAVVAAIEEGMLAPLSGPERERLRTALVACTDALDSP